MTAVCRIGMKFVGMAWAVAIVAANPAAAQNSDQPVDVTAAPPPTEGAVGPAQLRDFSLGGPSTRPQPPASAAAQPNTAAPTPSSPASSTRPAEQVTTPPTRSDTEELDRARPQPSVATTETAPTSSSDAPVSSVASGDVVTSVPAETVADPEATGSTDRPLPWPWLAAFAALLAGAGYWWMSRRSSEQRGSDPGRMAFAGAVADSPAPVVPRRIVPPTADPIPPSAPGPLPPAAVTAPASKPPISDGRITSTALKPSLTLALKPDRLVLTASDVAVQFELVVENVGGGPARDVLIEAIMVTASPTQDQEIANFFSKPRSEGDRIPVIPPLGKLPLKTGVRLSMDQVRQFEAGGRKLFVPLLAFNLIYRAGGEERQNSASFMIGRGGDGDEKLAPFRLDLGPRIFRELSVRAHSAGLSS